MSKLRVYCLETLKKLSIYPLDKTPSAPSDTREHQNTWNNKGKGLTLYSSSLYMKGVMAQPWLVQDLVCPQMQMAAWLMPRWLVVLGMVQKEEGIRGKLWWVGDNWGGWWGMTSQWCSLYPFLVRTIAGSEHTDHLVNSRSSPTPITATHHFSFRATNSDTSALHPLSSWPTWCHWFVSSFLSIVLSL